VQGGLTIAGALNQLAFLPLKWALLQASTGTTQKCAPVYIVICCCLGDAARVLALPACHTSPSIVLYLVLPVLPSRARPLFRFRPLLRSAPLLAHLSKLSPPCHLRAPATRRWHLSTDRLSMFRVHASLRPPSAGTAPPQSSTSSAGAAMDPSAGMQATFPLTLRPHLAPALQARAPVSLPLAVAAQGVPESAAPLVLPPLAVPSLPPASARPGSSIAPPLVGRPDNAATMSAAWVPTRVPRPGEGELMAAQSGCPYPVVGGCAATEGVGEAAAQNSVPTSRGGFGGSTGGEPALTPRSFDGLLR